METSGSLKWQSCSWKEFENNGRTSKCLLTLPRRYAEEWSRRELNLRGLKSNGQVGSGRLVLKLTCSYKNSGAPAIESKNFPASCEEALTLKRKAVDVAPSLNERSMYLVGMMGSGKTTVGKILSEVLGYSFFDSDKLVEQAVGATSVAQIFEEHSENFFRDNESEVLRDLSAMCRLVVATGGGAVIRPTNWRYMKKGITVWLDVPLDALARRIAAVGTASRPLLHQESGDAYTKAFARLSRLSDERGEAYTNADARVSLQYIATKQGHGDVSVLSPTAIAIEALIRIENFLKENCSLEEVRVSMDEI